MKKIIDDSINALADGLERISGPVDRAGHASERAFTLSKAGIPHAAIAKIFTSGSKEVGKKHRYTVAHIEGLVMSYEDSLGGTLISKAKTKALLKDQAMNNQEQDDMNPIR